MTGNDLFREVGNISEKYVTEAEETKRSIIHNVVFRRSLATAACLMVCVGLYFSTRTGRKEATADSSEGSGPQYDAATNEVHVAVGEQDADGGFRFKDILDSLGGNNKTDNAPQDYYQESASSSERVESETANTPEEDLGASGGYWMDTIDRLCAYPNDYKALLQTDAFVVAHGTVKSGMPQWEAFLQSVEQGDTAYVDVVQFTEEGDAVISAVVFLGDWYYVLADHTRDAWGKQDMLEYEYRYLYLDRQDGRTRVVLTDLKLGEEEISNAIDMEPTEFFELIQYVND
ncbi:MAG: DUF4362 domain-containing protein [Lachnospiraceae bacterium]|nr:DUF4362 domain-containing protein [Lachnospiraceae bacterium]